MSLALVQDVVSYVPFAAIGAGIGIGRIGGSAMDAIARQPEMQGKIQSSAIVLIAFVEAVALFAVVVSLIAK
jgi:F-type H+-transporting ATPase subunit c